MYCTYFGFIERPFNLTPNPAFIFLSRAHQESFAHLIYGIENRCGFIMLTGEVGAGKTTVIRTLLAELKPETHATALILNPMVSADGLLRAIMREFGIASDECREPADMVEALNRFLLQQMAADRKVVLVIDEAQDMEPSVLEQVRLISNLETTTDKLIQIILVGQPELESLMGRDDLRQLNQRITVRFHLTPMELADTSDYLQHRIRTAAQGNTSAAQFSAAAVKRIHCFSGGLPRLINAAADRALLIAFNRGTREIDAAIAKQAIADVTRSSKDGKRRANRSVVAVILTLLVAFLLSGAIYLRQSTIQPARTLSTPAAEKTLADLAAASDAEYQRTTLAAVARVWGSAVPGIAAASTVEQALQQAGFRLHSYSGNLGGLIRLGYPALLECSNAAAKRYLVLTGVDQADLQIASADGTEVSLPMVRIEHCWTGKAVIPWRNLSGLPVPVRSNATVEQRQSLARLLTAADVWPAGSADYSDAALRSAIRTFQTRQGIEPTGVAGVLTIMQLYRFSKELQVPSLHKVEQTP